MMTILLSDEQKQPRDTAYWAEGASVFKVERVPTGALNLNVEGHEVLSPLQGFGQLWQKVYQARVKNACIDKRMQWSQAGNIWQNAAIRTVIYTMLTPLRWIRERLRRRDETLSPASGR